MKRKPSISSIDYAKAFPDRLAIHRYYRRWQVWKGWSELDDFPTHAEAVTFAQREAILQSAAKYLTTPPESEPTC